MVNQEPHTDYSKPVAYDTNGRPLYAHPPKQEAVTNQEAPQVVYMSRAVDPHDQEPSEEVKAKHDISKRQYPTLNLTDHEYVVSAIKRHPIGLFSIWAIVLLALFVIIVMVPAMFVNIGLLNNLSGEATVSGGFVLLLSAILIVLGGVIATVVYEANRFYLTNESVIQHIQSGLFTKKDQIISLSNIEDASYRQHGLLQTVFNYGSIRLSTEGEETTYRFNFVANPKKQVDLLNDAVEAFKNYRPIDDSTDD